YYGDGANSPGGAAAGSAGGDPGSLGYSGAVRLADGSFAVSDADLYSGGFGMPWSQTRTITDELTFAYDARVYGRNGNGVIDSNLPSLINATRTIVQNGSVVATKGTMVAVTGGRSAVYFDLGADSTTFTARFFEQDTLRKDTASDSY